jgi:DNA-binding CsgD family transcriptional regulator
LCADPAQPKIGSVRPSTRQLVGREEELGELLGLLEAPERLPGVAVLPGEAGIGKTTLWLAGAEAAARLGYRVLSTRPAEAETRFSFAGLTDLLGDAAADVVPALPPVQRRALEAALLLGGSETGADDRAVAASFLAAVRLLAGDGPVCLAIDDVQWLDAASLAAVRFALARLDGDPVASLVAVRGGTPDWLLRAVPDGRLQAVAVTGLSIGATRELLATRLGLTFPRPTLIRIWETSRGNPFFALELAGALQRNGGRLGPGELLPIPTDLDELLRARLDGLSPEAVHLACVVAALADPTVAPVEAAVGRRFDAALTETLAARIVELDGERLRLTHPLLGSAVSARRTPARRRALHARLAEVVPGVEERARHLALSTAEPNGQIAATLEAAARSAQTRGASAAAAELAEQAFGLTPAADAADARRRLFLAADRHNVAGDTARALALLTQARAEAAPGAETAAILIQLGDVLFDDEPRDAVAHYELALAASAEVDDALAATVQIRLADSMRWGAGIDAGLEYATRAVEAASRTDDVALKCSALASLSDWRFRAGHGLQDAQMDEALALERTLPHWPLVGGPLEYCCHQLVWAAELDRARSLLLDLCDVRRRQEAPSEAWALWQLGLLEWRAGNWADAERYAAASVELRTQLGGPLNSGDFPTAIIAAHTGRIVEARAHATRSIAWGATERIAIERSGHSWVLGFLELSLDDARAAVAHLRDAYELRNDFMLEPAQRLELGDLLEALIAVGELDEVEVILTAWEPRAAAVDRAWSLAVLARCRGLVLAARGDLDGAFTSFERSLAEHARSGDPFQEARTVLALGRTQRRAKRRGAARTTLEDALARFERLGAPLWAEQARAELKRIGGRAPSRGELTEAESRIARLVAEGRTNREVAAELFLTEHSVETALTRIYRKLGVRSRADLARLLAAKT